MIHTYEVPVPFFINKFHQRTSTIFKLEFFWQSEENIPLLYYIIYFITTQFKVFDFSSKYVAMSVSPSPCGQSVRHAFIWVFVT